MDRWSQVIVTIKQSLLCHALDIAHFPNDRAVIINNVYWRGTLEVI